MSYFSIDMVCGNLDCGHTWPELVERGTESSIEMSCSRCDMPARRGISVPMPLRASYRDGNGRFRDGKEASKLNREAAGATGQNKKELEKEIRKIGFRFNDK